MTEEEFDGVFGKGAMKESSRKLGEVFNFSQKDGEIKIVPKQTPVPSKNIGLNDNEQAAYDAFYKKHKHGSLKLTITQDTGIGINSEVSCSYCKKTKDITDYSCW